MSDKQFLCHQLTARQGIGVHVAVFIRFALFLLLVAVALVSEGVVGVEVDAKLSYLAGIIEVYLMLGRTFCSADTAILQMVVHGAVGLQVIVIVALGLHIVVGVLVEAAKRVVVVYLVVEAKAALKEWIVNLVLLFVGNYPQRVGKDGLFKLALLPPFVVSPKEICK